MINRSKKSPPETKKSIWESAVNETIAPVSQITRNAIAATRKISDSVIMIAPVIYK